MRTTTLRIGGGSSKLLSLSGMTVAGGALFLAPDEGTDIVRLRPDGDDYGAPALFDVPGLVPVPQADEPELDLEGLDHAAGALWLAGSHGRVRGKAGRKAKAADVTAKLETVIRPVRRQLLARIPLGSDGVPQRGAALPAGPGGLLAALADDETLRPFLEVPGKDNGVDIEGIAVVGDRVLLGMRGPVLRGWAVVLEIEPRSSAADPEVLELADLGGGARHRRHVLDLDGLGIRDLAVQGDDLLVLTGPTMVLDGPATLVRVRGGARELPVAVTHDDREVITELEVGTREDHPEALAVLGDSDVLVAYDSPSDHRRTEHGVRADIVDLS